MIVKKNKLYICLRGNYTRETIVKILEVGRDESQAEIVSLLPCEGKRSEDALCGQMWSVNNSWLVEMKDATNPNLLFSIRKREKKS